MSLTRDIAGSLEERLVFIATLLGGLAGLLALGLWARGVYRRTLGRRRDRNERLARLGPGAQLSFFTAVHGEPPALRATIRKKAYEVATLGHPQWDSELAGVSRSHEVLVERSYCESIFIDPFYYLQTISDDEDTVLAFSVTTRRRGFRPTFIAPTGLNWRRRARVLLTHRYWPRPLLRVQLGKTRFADLDPKDPEEFAGPHFRATIGARLWRYSEFHAHGNPGHYLTHVLTASNTAPGRGAGELVGDLIAQAGYHEWPYPLRPDPDETDPPEPRTDPEWDDIPAAHAFRRRTVITTFTAIHYRLWADNYPSTFGPQSDEVRLLP